MLRKYLLFTMFHKAPVSCTPVLINVPVAALLCSILWAGISCTSDKGNGQKPDNNKYQLFPEGKPAATAAARLSKEEALQQSAVVILSSSVRAIDSTLDRGTTQYLYQIDQAETILKPDSAVNISFPIRFVATESLGLHTGAGKPVYIFLDTLPMQSVVRQSARLKYRWLRKAPILNR